MKIAVWVAVAVVVMCASGWAELTPEQTKEAEGLIVQFGAAEFAVRQEAVKKLIEMGPEVLGLVEKALAETKDAEVKLRCQMVVRTLTKKSRVEEEPKAEEPLEERVVKKLGPVKWPLCFSADGSRMAARMERGNTFTVLVEGDEGPAYEKVGGMGAFSPDGERLCYLAQEAGQWFMVTDGKEGLKYKDVNLPAFSSDGKRMAYRAQRADGECMVVNDMEGRLYDSVSKKSVFSPDGKRLAYRAQRGGDSFVVEDGAELKAYDEVGEPVFSSDGKRLGYWARRAGRHFMVVDGEEGKTIYRDCGDPAFSSDGKRIAYGARRKTGEWCLVIDGKESGSYEHIGMESEADGPHFSPDGSRVACQVWHDGKRYMLVDGKETGPYDKISRPVFSPDGKHLAHLAGRGEKWLLVCDGREGKEYDAFMPGLFFSPDSKHLAYVAEGEWRWLMVVDGIETMTYWWVIVPRDFAAIDGRLRYNTIEDEEGCLKELDWPKGLDWTNGMKAVGGK